MSDEDKIALQGRITGGGKKKRGGQARRLTKEELMRLIGHE